MVRVSGLMELAKLPIPPVGPDGLTPAEQLAAIKQRVGRPDHACSSAAGTS